MPSYLTFAEYRSKSRIKNALIDTCGQPKVEQFLEEYSGTIRDRLTKRYAVDFTDPGPVPATIAKWLVWGVDYDVLFYVGGNPEGREDEFAKERWTLANDELKEAANSETGLFELPLRNTDPLGNSAINKGGPFVKSFLTPFSFWKITAGRRP
jgi:hypothetical protein